jgi:predicted AAA+ superfamily ATPase
LLATPSPKLKGRQKKRQEAETLEDLKIFHATDRATRTGKKMAKIEAYAKEHKVSVAKAMIALM